MFPLNIDLIVFMDKVEKPLDLKSIDVVNACMRYGRETYALRILQKIFEKGASNVNNINSIIDIFVQLNDWPNAIGIWKKIQENSNHIEKAETLSKLKMWDQVHPIFEDIFKNIFG